VKSAVRVRPPTFSRCPGLGPRATICHFKHQAWWYWQQAANCIYELPPGGLLDRHLRWYVPPSARVSTPQGFQLIHDDRLLSAALIAEIDRQIKENKLLLGEARSTVLDAYDPLNDLPDW
jgi:hypothetical protein